MDKLCCAAKLCPYDLRSNYKFKKVIMQLNKLLLLLTSSVMISVSVSPPGHVILPPSLNMGAAISEQRGWYS